MAKPTQQQVEIAKLVIEHSREAEPLYQVHAKDVQVAYDVLRRAMRSGIEADS